MHYELYIDLFFLTNFLMNTILLLVTARIMKCRLQLLRIFGGAMAGALLTCIVIAGLRGHPVVEFVLFHCVINVIMLRIGLKINWGMQMVRAYIILYVCTFIVGGVIGFLHSYIRAGSLFFFLAVLGYYLTLGVWEMLRYIRNRADGNCIVSLCLKGEECQAMALLDTGNRLRDGKTGKPVSVISGKLAAQLPLEDIRKLRCITYHSVGREEGRMPVLTLDYICIHGKEDMWIRHPVVAVGEDMLTSDEYEMILNPDIL